jgi:cell division protein FtsN
VFIKLLLPGTNGLKVSKAIHSAGTLKNVPLVVIVSEQGELDPRYTTTIGIVDILVKPFRSSEVIAKTIALLGEEAVTDIGDAPGPEHAVEEEIFVIDDDEAGAAVHGIAENVDRTHPGHKEETGEAAGSFTAQGKEGEALLQGTPGLRGLQEGGPKEHDLFSGISAYSGNKMTESQDAADRGPSPDINRPGDDYTDDVDTSGESGTSPVRRAVLVIAAIVAGVAVGMGGYLFFTAGTTQAPAQKQIKEVLPGPAAVPQTIPASPPAQPGAIPEIPVKEEPVSAGEAPQKESASHGPASSVEKVAGAYSAASQGPQGKAAADRKGMYILQAGVFGNKDNADALVGKIRNAGVTASIIEIESAGKQPLYKVTAGTFATREQAVETSELLGSKGIKTIVRRK